MEFYCPVTFLNYWLPGPLEEHLSRILGPALKHYIPMFKGTRGCSRSFQGDSTFLMKTSDLLGEVDFLHRLLYDNGYISGGITMKPGPSRDLWGKEKAKFSILEKDISASSSSNVVMIAAVQLQFRPTIRSDCFRKSY